MMDLQQLRDALDAAAAINKGVNAGVVRFRIAVAYADYQGSPFADVDPFGPVAGVTMTLDGTTLIDILPELAAVKQGSLI